jgi:hypothetical protein
MTNLKTLIKEAPETIPWGDITPLAEDSLQLPGKPYPIDALGTTLVGAVRAIQESTKTPDGLAAQAVLGAASLACAGHYDVELDGRSIPNTLYLLTVAASGERKSGCDKLALRPHRKREEEMRAEAKANSADDAAPPSAPPVLAIGDVTIEGLQLLLARGLSRVGIFTAEAGNLIGGWAMQPDQQIRTAASLSSFWDGSPETRARGTSGVQVLAGRRVSAHLGCQPSVAIGFVGNAALQGQGILGRILPSWPASTIGTRDYGDVNPLRDARFQAYERLMTEILLRPLQTATDRPGELAPRKMSVVQDARALWISFHDSVEKACGKGGKLSSIQAFGCKSAEHCLRIAAILAQVENDEAVSLDTMKQAVTLTKWYINEWLRIAGSGARTKALNEAALLLEWLRTKGRQDFVASDIYQGGPTRLRGAKTAKAAIAILERHNIARSVTIYRDGKELLGFEVNPNA